MSLSCGFTNVRSETNSLSTDRVDLLPNRFTDDQVLMGTFLQELENVARILRPFVHW